MKVGLPLIGTLFLRIHTVHAAPVGVGTSCPAGFAEQLVSVSFIACGIASD
jgi:hypothetical protein